MTRYYVVTYGEPGFQRRVRFTEHQDLMDYVAYLQDTLHVGVVCTHVEESPEDKTGWEIP